MQEKIERAINIHIIILFPVYVLYVKPHRIFMWCIHYISDQLFQHGGATVTYVYLCHHLTPYQADQHIMESICFCVRQHA